MIWASGIRDYSDLQSDGETIEIDEYQEFRINKRKRIPGNNWEEMLEEQLLGSLQIQLIEYFTSSN